MSDDNLSTKLDAAWGNPDTWILNGLHWTHLEPIRHLINQRVSGTPTLSPLGWFAVHVAQSCTLPLGRVLVLGCGQGRVERDLFERGCAKQLVAFDLSGDALDVARAAAQGNPAIHYVRADMENIPLGEAPFLPGSFDAVVGVASVHHCSNIARLYACVHSLLKPDGWFFMDEYVGPDRFQYINAHMSQVNALTDLLPDWLLMTHSGQVRRGLRAPTVKEVVAVDPTEAVCSSQILPSLAQYFDVESLHPYGGSLLQVVLAEVAQNFQSEAAQPWLQALIETENELDRLQTLEHHFCCVIARPRNLT